MTKQRNHKKRGRRGYRLHDARIAYSGGKGSMRSIKYELVDPSETTGLRDKIAEAVIFDNRWLYGNINLNDYLEWRAEKTDDDIKNGDREASFLEFWIKALNLGFVFSNKTELEWKNYKQIKSWQEQCFDSIPDDLCEKLNANKWINWISTPVRPASGTEASLKRKITDLFIDRDSIGASAIANRWYELCQVGTQNDIESKKALFNITEAITVAETKSIYWMNDVDFEPFGITDWTELLDKIIAYWSKRVGETTAKKFLGVGENGNHFNNGLFGEFFTIVRSGNWAEVVNNLALTFGLNETEVKTIIERLKKLRTYAEQLPETPSVTKKWSDYRSDFSGTIESWFSNRVGKQQLAFEQLEGKTDEKTAEMSGGLKVLLRELGDNLPDDCEIKDGILAETLQYLAQRSGKIDRIFSGELETYLATLRSDLNEYMQQFKDGKTGKYSDDAPKLHEIKIDGKKIDWQKELKRHIQLSPLFFGESKRKEWEQIYNLKQLIKSETEAVGVTLTEDFADGEITDKQIQSLAELAGRLKNDGNKEVVKRLGSIEKELGLDFSDIYKKPDGTLSKDGRIVAKYYLSGFERGKLRNLLARDGKAKTDKNEYTEFNRIKISRLLELANLDKLYEKLETTPQDNFVLRDTVQLSKIITAAKLTNANKKRQIENTLRHSNLQGYSAQISKTAFISRYSVQSTNGEQAQLAMINDKTRKNVLAERYAYAFAGFGGNKIEIKQLIKKGNDNENYSVKENAGNWSALKVVSSRYQIQFLEWMFGKHIKKQTTLQLGGAFTIAEKSLTLDWSGKSPRATSDEVRLFISQPFTIIPTGNQLNKRVPSRYIGVDIGEYGLAWSLIEVDNDTVKQLESGFIVDPQQRVLGKAVNDWRKNQVRQTFNSMDTYVARLRESATGSLRNQLESLSIAKDARLSFEYEVDAFEVGGNKVKKLYASIKQSSVRREGNDAFNNQNWGKLTKPKDLDKNSPEWIAMKADWAKIWAFETTAAGTSRICTKCKKDASEFIDWDGSSWREGETLYTKEKGERLYDRVRPDLGDGKKRAFAEEKLKEAGISLDLDKFMAERGAIGLYVCPNCGHIADADYQAAFNIAVRGYLKDRANSNLDFQKYLLENYKDEKGKPVLKVKGGKIESGLSREILTAEETKLSFDPIGLIEP